MGFSSAVYMSVGDVASKIKNIKIFCTPVRLLYLCGIIYIMQ